MNIFLLFVLLFWNALALCDPSGSVQGVDMNHILSPDAVTQHTDLSISYLNQIFGTVGNLISSGGLTGNGSQMMGQMFYMLNCGIFAILIVSVVYMLIINSIRLASEGVVISQGRSTVFSLFKLILGAVLLVPMTSTGYSFLQQIVMYVVVKGVGLADSVWNRGLDYLAEGGVIWVQSDPVEKPLNQILFSPQNVNAFLAQPNGSGMKSNDQNLHQASTDPNSFLAGIFLREVCMVASRDPSFWNSSVSDSDSSTSKNFLSIKKTPLEYNVFYDQNNHQFLFPGSGNHSPYLGRSDEDPPACGTVRIADIQQNLCPTTGSSVHCEIAESAVMQLIQIMLPVAQNTYCNNAPSDSSYCTNRENLSDLYQQLGTAQAEALFGYYPTMRSIATVSSLKSSDNEMHDADGQPNATASQSTVDQFIQQAKAEGWIMAGRYYWNIMRFTSKEDASLDLSVYAPNLSAPNPAFPKNQELKKLLETAANNFYDEYSSGLPGSSGAPADTQTTFQKTLCNSIGGVWDISRTSCITADGIKHSGNEGYQNFINPMGAAALTLSLSLMNPGALGVFPVVAIMLENIAQKFQDFSNSDNPIQFLYDIGSKMLDITLFIWIGGAVFFGLGVLVLSFCSSMLPTSPAATVTADWVQPMFLMIATFLWMGGVFLTCFVPLYPFMIFLLAAFGWFISVIEAMVAAPLVALGLTHPEGHDLLGKSEQALMLLLSVFIQPSLLVIGLVAGIILSFVSFKFLIYAFSNFMLDILKQPNAWSTESTNNVLYGVVHSYLVPSGANPVGLLVNPVFLVIFCGLIWALLSMSFSVIHVLRDNALRWIGAPPSGLANPEQQLQQSVRSPVSDYSGQASKTSTTQAFQGGAKEALGVAQSGDAIKNKNKDMEKIGGQK